MSDNETIAALNKAIQALNQKIDALGENQKIILDTLSSQIAKIPSERYISNYEKDKLVREVGSYIDTIPNFLMDVACIAGGKNDRLLLLLNVLKWFPAQKGDIILEFGVFRGESLSTFSQNSESMIYGFDSFEGMPHDEHFFKKRQFNNPDGIAYPLRDNVELVRGWFKDTIPSFIEKIDWAKVKIVHIDCDIYSSTADILNNIADRLLPGTCILFDEYWNWPGWKDAEFKAWQEYIKKTGRTYQYVGYVDGSHQVAIKLLD